MQNDNPAKTVSAPRLVVILSVLVACVIAGVAFWLAGRTQTEQTTACFINPNLEIKTLSANGAEFQAEVAASGEDQQQGLSDRDCLGDGKAMLFTYGNSGNYCYWMKDMRFAIDMVWLDSDKKVITIKDNVEPNSYPNSFCPESPAQYVVEVNSGVAKSNNWQTGTQFSF